VTAGSNAIFAHIGVAAEAPQPAAAGESLPAPVATPWVGTVQKLLCLVVRIQVRRRNDAWLQRCNHATTQRMPENEPAGASWHAVKPVA
jgi:hypothetical protein